MAWRGPGSQMSDPRDDAPGAVPEEVVNQAKAAFGRRRPGDIAVLVWDSLVDDDDAPEDHRLVFEHPDVQIEVRVRASAGSSDLEGRVKPAGVLHVELQSDSEEVAVYAPRPRRVLSSCSRLRPGWCVWRFGAPPPR